MTYVDPGLGIGDIPLGAASGGKVPIGVPKGYTIRSRVPTPIHHGGWGTRSMQVEQGPRYFQGDEWRNAPAALEDVSDLQRALIQVGFLDSTGVVYGSWDDKTATAFAKVLASANQSGAMWQDALATRLALVDQQGGLKAGRAVAPLTIKLTNPDDLKKVANNVAKNLYGGNLPDDDLNRFVSAYQASEAQAQSSSYAQQYNASGTGYGAGGTVTAPADPSVAAEKQIRGEHPLAVAQQGFIDAFDPLLKTFTQRMPGGGV